MMTKKEILQSIKLRQSTIRDYLNCPLLFQFKHLNGIPPEFRNPAALHGSTLHRLLYMIHNDQWDLDVSEHYRDIFLEYEIGEDGESKIPVKWKDRKAELGAFEQNAVEILDGYRKKPENRKAKVLYAEQPFRVKIAGYYFTGTIDQVRRNADGTTELIDFKSGKQRPSDPALHNDWQLSLYHHALKYGELKTGEEWIKPNLQLEYSTIYFLRGHEIRKRSSENGSAGEEKGDPFIRTKKSVEDLRKFRKYTANLLKAMLRDWYFPNPNHCYICAYTSHCMNEKKDIADRVITRARRRLKQVQTVST
jgi:RecB family exonuclease